jgi:hypothetical protein
MLSKLGQATTWTRLLVAGSLVLGSAVVRPAGVMAQDPRDEQFYYPGSFNWQFLQTYNNAGRLFNAFDYGHAVLYEKLLTRPQNLREELEEKQFTYLTTNLLVRPPRFAVAEEAIEPAYAKLAWQAKMMFDWAHVLHRQVYDIYADDRISQAEKDSLIEKVTDYYLTNTRLAFVPVPKSMTLMDDQYYSQVFRKGYPKFNGLIWAYHWLQVGLYEPLIAGKTRADKEAGVDAALARFWSMIQDAPRNMPKMMPMAAAVAPRFSAAHPRAAVIFDNLHMMHDIISDILAADTVPRNKKREVIYAALREFRDSTRNVMSMDEWRNMGAMMGGIAAMGGPATGILPAPPSRNGPADAMAGTGEQGMQHGAPAPKGDSSKAGGMRMKEHGMEGMEQADSMDAMPGMDQQMQGMKPDSQPSPSPRPAQGRPHEHTGAAQSDTTHPGMAAIHRRMRAMMELQRRMLADPAIRRRVMADSALRRLLRGAAPAAADSTPAMHHHDMPGMEKP